MKGIGYMHPEWGHGMWKGELAFARRVVEGRRRRPDGASRTSTSSRWCGPRRGDQVGIGVLEQISFGPHARYGFTSILDMAK